MNYSTLAEEQERLTSLHSYGILDTEQEKDFDDLVALTAHICKTPIALISLVDEHRQWFKAAYGLTIKQTPRNYSFCSHAIQKTDLFTVSDALLDDRFSTNPMVTGDPNIRFYAGSPLLSPDGATLGTLCVIDHQSRVLTLEQESALAVLSRHVIALLELRRSEREVNRANKALLSILEDAQKAEAAMREIVELNRGVLNSMLAHIAVVDREATIIAVNDAWRQFASAQWDKEADLPIKTDVGRNYFEACRLSQGQSNQVEVIYQGLLEVLAGKRDHFSIEYPCHKQDEKRWFLMSATPLKTSKGGAAVSHLDITDRKRAEGQITEQAAFMDKARDAIVARDLSGKILFWNQGAERLYGWKRHEVLGCQVGELLHVDPTLFTEINQQMIAQEEWSGEFRHLTKDRNELIVESRWTLIRDEEGQPKSILGINTDVTEKKKIEAQFLRAQRMESIGTLASGIAHDLNNILAPIMMSIEFLKMTEKPESTHVLDMIATSAQRGADIVRQVLSFARGIEGERIEIRPQRLIQDLEQIIKDTFPKDIRLQFSVPDEVWNILGDPTQVQQVLLNLCVNGRDAMLQGGTLSIDVENCQLDEQYAAMNLQAKPGRYVKISVTDRGTGISPDIQDKIFEPFFTTKDIDKGTGLGLSTVMAIVRSHHGMVNLSSELGKGTTFRVYFPAMDMSSDPSRPATEEILLPRGHGEMVLLVDDEASIRRVTSQTLQTFGYRVMVASDGAEALALYAQNQREISVILTDMKMPILDGSATIQALLRINPFVKIIAASGLDAHGGTAKLLAAGVKHFLNKPYTAETLLKSLRSVLDE